MDYPTHKLTTNFFATLNTQITRLIAAGEDIIRLDVGSPDLPPAPHVIEALARSAQKPDTHGYQSHRGTAALREAWTQMYARVHGVTLEPDGVLPLLGSKEGVFHLSIAFLNPGDVVLVPDPGYQTYTQGAYFAGVEVVSIPLFPGNGYLPDLSSIPTEVARRAKILWLNYPHNPTAAVASLDTFAEAVDFCRQHEILLCHDAAYTQVTFDGYYAPSVLEVQGALDVAVEFTTLSKSHNMAGWRVGAAVGCPDALDILYKLKTHVDSGYFKPVMEAAVAALTGDQSWLEGRNAVYQERRDIVIEALQEMGLNPRVPQASLYVWCPVPDERDSDSFVLSLLEKGHVSLAPGSIFGAQGKGFVRISLVQPADRMAEAMERFKRWLNNYNPRVPL